MTLKRNNGFSLVELVLTIILLGILSVTVFPRIFDDSDVAPNVFQAQLISVLRNMQIRAMSDTREFPGEDYPCFKVNFDNFDNAFGPPPLTYYSTVDPDAPDDEEIIDGLEQTCEDYIETSTEFNPEGFFATAEQLAADRVDLKAVNSDGDTIDFIEFDGGGIPSAETGDCLLDPGNDKNGCIIEFCAIDCEDSSNARAVVCVEPQGYIHAGLCGV
ncbi:MAG: type II secretion system protein [Aestuariibacter sp.]